MCITGGYFFFLRSPHFTFLDIYHRMFALYSSSVALLEIIASQCALPSHSYLREVGGDGSILGGVELELDVLQGARPARIFFWACASVGSPCPYEESAFQAVRFLQTLYGFILHDFNYEGMVAYREIAQSAVFLAGMLARSVSHLSCIPADGSIDGTAVMVQWQLLSNQLLTSVCNI